VKRGRIQEKVRLKYHENVKDFIKEVTVCAVE
jgi:hypothetical protein